MDCESAIEYALDGDAVLFVGAGFSMGALNLRGQPFKRGAQLAEHFAQLAGLPLGTDLEDAAEEFISLQGEDALIRELQQEFAAKEIATSHLQLAKIPWRRVYTTNYDDVLEKAYSANSRRLSPVTLGDNLREISKDATLCVHFNGYVDRLTRESVWSEVKLTDTSYLTADVAASPWAILLREDISSSRAVFFVGYSLADLDIRRVLFQTSQTSDKCFFVVGQNPDLAIRRRLSRFGTVMAIDASAFAEMVEQKSRGYVPSDLATDVGYCLRRATIPVGGREFSDGLVFDLLFMGGAPPSAIWSSLHEGPRFFLERGCGADIIGELEAGHHVVIHSELANGKTLLVEGLKYRALERGFDVYTLVNSTEDLPRDIEQIRRLGRRALIVLEDYTERMDAIGQIARYIPSNCALVLTARSSLNDVFIDRLSEILSEQSVSEVSVDRLSDADVEWVSDFLDEYGLWGEKAGWSRDRKLHFLKRECNREFHAVLVLLFSSPQVASRFDRIVTQLNGQRDYYQVLITILVLTALFHRPVSVDRLVDLWGERVLRSRFQRDPIMQQLVDFRSGEIRLRSSATAEFILKHVANINLTIDTLITLAREADKASATSDFHHEILMKLMRFSEVQHLVPEQEKRRALIRYYEGIKNLRRCRRFPLFWLQYAIACLVLGELERAQAYFDTAYALAKTGSFDTFQIDNHYARFLLVAAVEKRDVTNCMTAFRRARTIIHRQILEKSRYYYPYRVACNYIDFWQAYAPYLKADERDEVSNSAAYIAKRIEQLPADRRNRRDVQRCDDYMHLILMDSGVDTQDSSSSADV